MNSTDTFMFMFIVWVYYTNDLKLCAAIND